MDETTKHILEKYESLEREVEELKKQLRELTERKMPHQDYLRAAGILEVPKRNRTKPASRVGKQESLR